MAFLVGPECYPVPHETLPLHPAYVGEVQPKESQWRGALLGPLCARRGLAVRLRGLVLLVGLLGWLGTNEVRAVEGETEQESAEILAALEELKEKKAPPASLMKRPPKRYRRGV